MGEPDRVVVLAWNTDGTDAAELLPAAPGPFRPAPGQQVDDVAELLLK